MLPDARTLLTVAFDAGWDVPYVDVSKFTTARLAHGLWGVARGAQSTNNNEVGVLPQGSVSYDQKVAGRVNALGRRL